MKRLTIKFASAITCIAAVLALTASAAAQQGVGAAYAARDPHPCPHVKAPANGPPSVATAMALAVCAKEKVIIGSLFLVSDMKIEVGRGTPYRELGPRNREGLGDADVTGSLYSLRGSYMTYNCTYVNSGSSAKAGQNCDRYPTSDATGYCYRNNFGEWSCDIGGGTMGTSVPNQPPPGK